MVIATWREVSGSHRRVAPSACPSLAFIGSFQGLGIEHPCCRLTQRSACGPNVFYGCSGESSSRNLLHQAFRGLNMCGRV